MINDLDLFLLPLGSSPTTIPAYSRNSASVLKAYNVVFKACLLSLESSDLDLFISVSASLARLYAQEGPHGSTCLMSEWYIYFNVIIRGLEVGQRAPGQLGLQEGAVLVHRNKPNQTKAAISHCVLREAISS